MATSTLNVRMDKDIKREMDAISAEIGLTTAAAVNVFARQFIAHRGFPFEVVAPAPTEREFAEEMDRRYEEMLAGSSVEHDLIEV